MVNGRHSKHSDLLALLNQRKTWELSPHYVIPQQNSRLVSEAINLYTLANDSDPFARDRIRLHLAIGFEYAPDVIKDARGQLQRRGSEAPTAFANLEPVKKQQDEERAWTQHVRNAA